MTANELKKKTNLFIYFAVELLSSSSVRWNVSQFTFQQFSLLFLLFTAPTQPRRRHHNKVCHHITFEVCVLHAFAERRHQQRDSSVSSSSISPQPPFSPFSGSLLHLYPTNIISHVIKRSTFFTIFNIISYSLLFFIPQTRALFFPLLAHFLSNKRRRRWCLLFFALRREKHGSQ